MRLRNSTALGQGEDPCRRCYLAGMGTHAVDSRIESGPRTTQRLDAERGNHVGGQQEPLRVVQQQAGGAGHEVRAVEDAERILGLQLEWLNAQGPQRVRATLSLTLEEHVALADQHQAEVGGWCQVAAGTE